MDDTTGGLQQKLRLQNRSLRPIAAYSAVTGVPWPQGEVDGCGSLTVSDERDRPVPASFKTLNTWPDGSVQWSLVDLCVDFDPREERAFTVKHDQGAAVKPDHPVVASITSDSATVENGLVKLVISGGPGRLIDECSANGKPLLTPDGFDITFADADGKIFSVKAAMRTLRLEHQSPLRTVLRVDSKHAAEDGTQLLDCFLRFEIRANRADVKLTYNFRNREKPTPGIEVYDVVARFSTTMPDDAKRCFMANYLTSHYLAGPLRVDEDPQIVASDTGDINHYLETHKEGARGECFVHNPVVLHDPEEEKAWYMRNPTYRVQAGGSKCVWPYLGLMGSDGGVLMCFEKFVTLHPGQLTVRGSEYEASIWPNWAGPLNITQGAGRSHVLYLAPLPADASDVDIQDMYIGWEFGGFYTHTPPFTSVKILPDIDHVRACKVFALDKLPAYEPQDHLLFEGKLALQWIGLHQGNMGIEDEVRQLPSAGIWDYGDDSRTNNEEMHSLVYFQNYFRTGEWGCAEHALAGTKHMLEVDHCAFSENEFQNGAQVAHCHGHNTGPAYPSHMWFTEYLFAYVLTGDEEFIDAAKRSCENLLHWVHSDMGFKVISNDHREAGQPMINFTWCYQFNRDPRYLEACWKIIREYLMVSTQKYGRMLAVKPIGAPVKACVYGDYASWEGMYWLWELTGDEQLKQFMLSQLQWRVDPQHMGVYSYHRATDFNPAAYAYYLTGDSSWLARVGRLFKPTFGAANWGIGWIHSMYYIKLAFEHGIITDDDISL